MKRCIMEHSIIKVENLSVCYHSDKIRTRAVNNVSFNLDRGNSFGIIGESGSGKTSMAMAMMGLLKKPATVDGQVYYGNKDLNSLSEKERNLTAGGRLPLYFKTVWMF